jgi:hypothetical protein
MNSQSAFPAQFWGKYDPEQAALTTEKLAVAKKWIGQMN